MKKIIILIAVLLSLWGCSNDNKLIVQNKAEGPVFINFLASIDSVFPGATTTLPDIPNGTYEYNTTYGVPSDATSSTVSGAAGSGQLTFEKKNTKILLLYSSTTMAGAYTLYVNKSSSQPISTGSPTGTQ